MLTTIPKMIIKHFPHIIVSLLYDQDCLIKHLFFKAHIIERDCKKYSCRLTMHP